MPNLNNSILIIPAVSVANVPQLTSDLLLHSLGFVKVACLDDTFLYPFAAPVDYVAGSKPPPGVSAALEVFFSEAYNLTLVQQRSPILPGFAAKYVSDVVVPFVNKHSFRHVVLLELAQASLGNDGTAAGSTRVFSHLDAVSDVLSSLKIADAHQLDLDTPLLSFGDALVLQCGNKVQWCAFLTYVYEGDNFHDATRLADDILKALGIGEIKWLRPVSWTGVYGDRPVPLAMEDGLFG